MMYVAPLIPINRVILAIGMISEVGSLLLISLVIKNFYPRMKAWTRAPPEKRPNPM